MRFVVRCSSNHILSYKHRQIHKGRDTEKNKTKQKQTKNGSTNVYDSFSEKYNKDRIFQNG